MARLIEALGKSFWLPDPDSVSHLAGAFGAIRDNLGETDSQLQALRSPGSWADWTGPAADAFARCLGQLPGQLSQAHESYATVAAALSSYAAGLYPVVNALLSLATEAEEAEGTLRTATAEVDYARHTGNQASVTYWESRVRAASGTVQGLVSRLGYLLGELDGLSTRCVQQIRQAQHEGIQNTLITDFQRYVLMDGGTAVHDAHKAMDIAGGVLDDMLIKPFTNLPGDWENFITDRNAHTAGLLLGDVGDALGVLGLVAAVVAVSILTGGAADVFAGAAVFLGDAALVAHTGALAADSEAVITDEPDVTWWDVGKSALSVVSDGGGEVVGDGMPGVIYGVGSGVETTAFDDGMEHVLSVPEVAPSAPDLTDGLQITSDAVQGLQGLPVAPGASQPTDGAGLLQPAVSPASPAVVNVQHITFSLQSSGATSNAGSDTEMGM
jgi:hypothetical protein